MLRDGAATMSVLSRGICSHARSTPEVIYLAVIQYSLIVVISVFSTQPTFSITPSVKQYKMVAPF